MTKILVVEDNADLAFGLRNNLEIEGYAVTVAEDGARGLQAARDESPDLLILDEQHALFSTALFRGRCAWPPPSASANGVSVEAAAKALEILSRPMLEREPTVARVNWFSYSMSTSGFSLPIIVACRW